MRQRPHEAVVALMPSTPAAGAAYAALHAAGHQLAGAHLLVGIKGSRIVDRQWAHRGRLARLTPDVQNVGYYEVVLAEYGSGLRGGGALMIVPCHEGETRAIEQLLGAHGAHALNYFGSADVKKLGPSWVTSDHVVTQLRRP